MYFTKNPLGMYYYRRPVLAEDQHFWLGPNGTPKKEWSRSLGTKDRRTGIARMNGAAELYEAERAAQYARNAIQAPSEAPQVSQREREEQEAVIAMEVAKAARHEERRPYRILLRQRMQMSTAALTPDEAAWRDLVNEAADAATVERATTAQRTANDALAEGMNKAPANGPTLEKLIEAYEAAKSPGWSGSSKKAIVPVFRLLRSVFPGRLLTSVTREDARGVVKLLEALPTQIGKRKELKGLTIRQAIEKGKELDLPTIQPKTINDGYLLHIASMWNWAIKEQWIVSSPFSALAVYDPVDDADRRDPFTAEQLQTLFSGPPWAAPWVTGGEMSGEYWVPLLCLFQGFRNAEAAGLRVADVGLDDGIPVLFIRPYVGRSLKNKDARGTVAIHPEILRMGFLSHVAHRKAAGETLLFPEGVTNSRGQVAAKLSERFSRRVRALGFVGTKLGTHSFRHCFEDRLRAAELAERTALALARRSEPGSSRIYGDGLSARQKAEAIAKIGYPGLDLSHLLAAKRD